MIHRWTPGEAKRRGSQGGKASAKIRRKRAALRIAAQLTAIIPREAHARIEAQLEKRDYALWMALLVRAAGSPSATKAYPCGSGFSLRFSA